MSYYAITICRKSAFACAGKTYRIFLNGQKIGKLSNGETVTFEACGGENTLSFKAYGKEEVFFTCNLTAAAPKLTFYARCNSWSGLLEVRRLLHNDPRFNELLFKAAETVIDFNNPYISFVQRKLRLNYKKAAEIVDYLCHLGVVSNFADSASQEVLMSRRAFDDFCLGYISNNNTENYSFVLDNKLIFSEGCEQSTDTLTAPSVDELLFMAGEVVLEIKQASISMLQKRLKLGYSCAARLMDHLEKIGLVGPFSGSTPRQILMTRDEFITAYNLYLSSAAAKSTDKFAVEPATQIIADNIFEAIDVMTGAEFEQWCAELLRDSGFENVEISAKSGDQGVDILAEKNDITYAIQCKCYSHDLGNTPVQEVLTGKAIYQRHVAAVMTNRYFTNGAKDAAKATGVLLWDRDKLLNMYKVIHGE